jgi:hypothetical protein
MSTIEDAIAAAKANAANIPAEVAGNGVATYAPQAGLPAQRGAPLGINDMLGGSLNVVAWLKVNELGLRIGTDNTLFDELNVAIPMNEVAYCYSVRYGNPAVYEKTYDRVTNSRGGSWMDTLARAQRVDPKASEFRSADVPFYALEDIKNKKGEVLVKEGEAIGHSLAVTGWKAFQQFAQKAQAAGMDIQSGIIKVKLGFVEQKNQKGTWGILKFGDPELMHAFPWDLN